MPTRYRMIFAGPVGAGKTTAVRALSDVPMVDTEVPMSAVTPEGEDKTTTTVGLDYGSWKPTTEVSVALIGIAGQQRFASARQTATLPGTRILLWLRADRSDMAAEAEAWLAEFAGQEHRVVIAISHAPDRTVGSLRRALAEVLQRHGLPPARVLLADARDRDSVIRVACAALDLPEENR